MLADRDAARTDLDLRDERPRDVRASQSHGVLGDHRGANQVGETDDVSCSTPAVGTEGATCVKSSDSHGYGQQDNGVFDRFEFVSGIGDDDQTTG